MDLITELRASLGDLVIPCDASEGARRRRDFMVGGVEPVAIAYPRTTEDVSRILAACNARGQAVIPQGGLTGLSGGATPGEGALALSLDRMNRIEEVDVDACAITVQAGVVLQAVQTAADNAGMLFPLDLGGRGSAQVGGLISTNAGGNRVLRYGMMRDLVLGIEAVLPGGEVISSLNKMLKNNTGYDLKQLFIGSEGTLGVVTRANLKLFPKPRSVTTALCALPDYEAVMKLLARVRGSLGGTLSAFEVMWPDFYRLAIGALGRRPLSPDHGLYVLCEALGSDQEADQARFEAVIGEAIEAGEVEDAVLARSSRETGEIWAIRDIPGEFDRIFPQIPFDVSIPTGQIGAFRQDLAGRLEARWPDIRVLYFGHVADSNLHVAVQAPAGVYAGDIKAALYDTVRGWKGSISAEHGIGSEKRAYLAYSRHPAELALMRTLKDALDPKGILNPGKVLGG